MALHLQPGFLFRPFLFSKQYHNERRVSVCVARFLCAFIGERFSVIIRFFPLFFVWSWRYMIATSLFDQRMQRIFVDSSTIFCHDSLVAVIVYFVVITNYFAMPTLYSHSISNFDNENVYSDVIIKMVLLSVVHNAKKEKNHNSLWNLHRIGLTKVQLF